VGELFTIVHFSAAPLLSALLRAPTLILLFAGIHNAWDAVVYHLTVNLKELQ
jgi:hypothetical protein